jgi:exo-beta-1,3-glucanase (GH17 family)
MSHDVLESLRDSRRWINYQCGPPFDFLAGQHPATPEQLRSELQRLHDAGFRGLVTNTMAFGVQAAPQIAKDCGFEHVVVKLWWQDDDLLAEEKRNLDAVIESVDAVCVGNEIIQKGIADHDRLVREVDEARERFGRPVTTGFQPPDWQYFPDLATEVGDFCFLNLHPWWVLHRNDPLSAAHWVEEAYDLVVATPGRPDDRLVVVQETSFPTGATAARPAPGATLANQKIFYEALLAKTVPFVWFLSQDSPLHRDASPVGGFGGLWDEHWRPKPVVDLLEGLP